MGPGKIVGPGHERPGEDRGMKEPKSPGQKVRTTRQRTVDAECGLGLYVESKSNTSESIYETGKKKTHRHRKQTYDYLGEMGKQSKLKFEISRLLWKLLDTK